jgi:hypothetical protein
MITSINVREAAAQLRCDLVPRDHPAIQNGDIPDTDRDVEPNVEVLLAKVMSTSSLAPCSTTTEQTLNEQEMARRVTDST